MAKTSSVQKNLFRKKMIDKYKIKHIILDRRLKNKISKSNYPHLLKEHGWTISFSTPKITILSKTQTNQSGEISVL